MVDILQDLFLAFLIIIGIYVFLPVPVQAVIRGMLHGMLPAMQQLGGMVGTGLRYVGMGLQVLIVGKQQPHNVSTQPRPTSESAPLQASQPVLQQSANVIAIQQNDYKTGFAIAPDVQKLADLLDADPDIIEQVAIVLARLCDADKLGETDAIKIGLGISPSSTSEKYKTAKAVLAGLRKPAKTEIVALKPDPERPNREVVVRA